MSSIKDEDILNAMGDLQLTTKQILDNLPVDIGTRALWKKLVSLERFGIIDKSRVPTGNNRVRWLWKVNQ